MLIDLLFLITKGESFGKCVYNHYCVFRFNKPDLNITNDSLLEKAYKNILPTEAKMLEDDIEIRHGSRPSSNSRSRGRKKGIDFHSFSFEY